MANHSRAATHQAWAERIDRFEQAGQTIAQFCAAEGVSAACFYQWRRKLRSAAPGDAATGRLPPGQIAKQPPGTTSHGWLLNRLFAVNCRSSDQTIILPETAMSWDAFIMRFGDAKSIDDFPPDFSPPPVCGFNDASTNTTSIVPGR